MSQLSKFVTLATRLARLTVNPRGLRFVLGTALGASAAATPGCDITQLPRVGFEELLAGCDRSDRVTLALFPGLGGSISPLESLCLAILMRRVKAKRVFEFGTFVGLSTTQLALNVEPAGTVFTLDLPDGDARCRLAIDDPAERALTTLPQRGQWVPVEVKPRVTFLQQDSADFDPAPHAGTMDLVFVDGAHSADYVRNDSAKGWAMLRSGGIIAWHDCRPEDPGVVHFLLSHEPRPTWIAGTSLAFAVKP